jgi:hypothetical protein
MNPTNTRPPDYAGFARDMRQRFLVRPPAEWGMVPTAANPDVYGVLMEWLADDATLTVAAFCDGSASVYSTRGTGMIGGNADDVVRSEARALVEVAGEFYEEASPVSEFPYPAPERVQFYLLTFTGVRVLDAALDSLCDGRSRYVELYDHGWAVFERFMIVTGQQVDGENGCGYEKEWSGPEGYVNCLLTFLARGIGKSFVISASEPVPDLAALAEGNDELQEWLTAQEFPYGSMDAKAIIRELRKAAGILAGLPFLTRRGELPAVHTTDEGETVSYVYDVEIAPFGRSAKVDLAPPDDPRVVALQRQTDARSTHAASG